MMRAALFLLLHAPLHAAVPNNVCISYLAPRIWKFEAQQVEDFNQIGTFRLVEVGELEVQVFQAPGGWACREQTSSGLGLRGTPICRSAANVGVAARVGVHTISILGDQLVVDGQVFESLGAEASTSTENFLVPGKNSSITAWNDSRTWQQSKQNVERVVQTSRHTFSDGVAVMRHYSTWSSSSTSVQGESSVQGTWSMDSPARSWNNTQFEMETSTGARVRVNEAKTGMTHMGFMFTIKITLPPQAVGRATGLCHKIDSRTSTEIGVNSPRNLFYNPHLQQLLTEHGCDANGQPASNTSAAARYQARQAIVF